VIHHRSWQMRKEMGVVYSTYCINSLISVGTRQNDKTNDFYD
jgi:hypothetical protein